MEQSDAAYRAIAACAARYQDYRLAAYLFVMAGLAATVEALAERRHVTGRELAEGIRQLALRQYGMSARLVLASWGVHETLDFGRIVYRLIDAGVLGRTESDSLEDFRDVYDFAQAFEHDYPVGSACRGG